MKSILCGIAAAGVLLAAPAYAHHSAAMFDTTKEITLAATVKDVQITNPHSWLQVLAPDSAGATVEWSIEMGNPGSLTRRGFKRSSLRPGDKVTVKIQPLKDGRPGGLLVSVTTAAGVVLPQPLASSPS
jgi:hypothetical protein